MELRQLYRVAAMKYNEWLWQGETWRCLWGSLSETSEVHTRVRHTARTVKGGQPAPLLKVDNDNDCCVGKNCRLTVTIKLDGASRDEWDNLSFDAEATRLVPGTRYEVAAAAESWGSCWQWQTSRLRLRLRHMCVRLSHWLAKLGAAVAKSNNSNKHKAMQIAASGASFWGQGGGLKAALKAAQIAAGCTGHGHKGDYAGPKRVLNNYKMLRPAHTHAHTNI